MTRRVSRRHLLPIGVLAFCAALDLVSGPRQPVIGLLAMAPLVAATVLGRRVTAAYALVALGAAAVLGLHGDQYRPEALLAQTLRLFGITVAGALALVACTLRLRREAVLARLSAGAATSRAAVQLAADLQRSLLTPPPAVPGLEMTARYVPAVRHARVGGDWYDAFSLPDGSTVLVIGDVAGHDVTAAATMAQAHGVLRGIAHTVPESPAEVLDRLDGTLQHLGVDTLITVVVATLRPEPTGGARLRWSDAGHPPPVLLHADGRVTVLDRPVNRLLGVPGPAVRTEHEVALGPGDTVVLYTDGLVERRGDCLDEGTGWLVRALGDLAGKPLDDLCDALLADVTGRRDDDVAVLAVRVC
ncbi:PP2C family protein-serine/threonine phosphatase [Modestobacter sp. URMC 112]